jgi:uncharacterized membrane protein YbhN (UPF0104 family)
MNPLSRQSLIIIKLVAGLILFVCVVAVTGNIRDIHKFTDIRWYSAWPVLLWTMCINLFAALRWQILMKHLSLPDIPLSKLLKVMVAGRIVGLSTSQMLGDMGSRLTYLKLKNIDMKKGSLSILLDKLLEFLLLLSVGIALSGWFILEKAGDRVPLFYIIISILIFLGFTWFLPRISGLAVKLLKTDRIPADGPYFRPFRIQYLLVFLTLCKYVAVVLRFLVILGLCGISLSFEKAFLGTMLAQLGMVIGITPGGLGFVEAGWAGALHFYNINQALIIKFLVLQRLLVLAAVILLAFIVFLLDKRTLFRTDT